MIIMVVVEVSRRWGSYTMFVGLSFLFPQERKRTAHQHSICRLSLFWTKLNEKKNSFDVSNVNVMWVDDATKNEQQPAAVLCGWFYLLSAYPKLPSLDTPFTFSRPFCGRRCGISPGTPGTRGTPAQQACVWRAMPAVSKHSSLVRFSKHLSSGGPHGHGFVLLSRSARKAHTNIHTVCLSFSPSYKHTCTLTSR